MLNHPEFVSWCLVFTNSWPSFSILTSTGSFAKDSFTWLFIRFSTEFLIKLGSKFFRISCNKEAYSWTLSPSTFNSISSCSISWMMKKFLDRFSKLNFPKMAWFWEIYCFKGSKFKASCSFCKWEQISSSNLSKNWQ